MPSITRGDLKTQARQRAEMEGSDFITDAELEALLNTRLADYHYLLAEVAGEEQLLKTASLSVSSGTASLPADYYQPHLVLCVGGAGSSSTERPIKMERLDPSRRSRVYAEDRSLDLALEYIPSFTELDDDSDTFTYDGRGKDFVLGWVVGEMLTKEESDARVWFDIAARAEERLRKELQRYRVDGMDFPDDRYDSVCPSLYYRVVGSTLYAWRDVDEELLLIGRP